MPDEDKAKEQLVQELAAMRQRVAEIENACKQALEELRRPEQEF